MGKALPANFQMNPGARSPCEAQFFVYIVESPSSDDLLVDRQEGQLLQEALRLSDVFAIRKVAATKYSFYQALGGHLVVTLRSLPVGSIPIIHLSAHGNDQGIGFTNGELITWPELREVLVNINQALSGSLILCVSACHGYSACRTSMAPSGQQLSYYALISHVGEPEWRDTAVGFISFYHLLFKGKSIADAVTGMKAASGDSNFVFELGMDTQKSWLQYVEAQSFKEAYERILRQMESRPPEATQAAQQSAGAEEEAANRVGNLED